MRRFLCWLLNCKPPVKYRWVSVPPEQPLYTFQWLFGPQSFVEGGFMRITTEQQTDVVVSPKTAAGNAARIDGDVKFASSDPAIAEVVVRGPRKATIKGKAPGVVQITADFDADLGTGVRAVSLSGALEVVEAEATTGEITFADPILQVPEAAPEAPVVETTPPATEPGTPADPVTPATEGTGTPQ